MKYFFSLQAPSSGFKFEHVVTKLSRTAMLKKGTGRRSLQALVVRPDLRCYRYAFYIYIYICIYIYIHIIHVHIYIYTCLYTFTYIHTYIHTCMHTYIHTYICIIYIYNWLVISLKRNDDREQYVHMDFLNVA